jgi:hypothetical protein
MKLTGESIALMLFLIGTALALSMAPKAMAQPAAEAAKAQLRRTFDRTFHQPGVRLIELRVFRGERVVALRRFEMAHRADPAGSRSLVRFVAPDYLRGHALLIVDPEDGPNDIWIYQPEERRPRRVGNSQKGDSFYGSDLALEDLERTRWDRWRIAAWIPVDEDGEACLVADAWPPPDSQYGRLRIWIATRIDGVLRIDFFARGDEGAQASARPLKRLRADLGDAVEEHGFLRFRRIVIEQIGRDARTELVTERIAIDPTIASSLFSAMRLEREGEGLFDLAERHARGTKR